VHRDEKIEFELAQFITHFEIRIRFFTLFAKRLDPRFEFVKDVLKTNKIVLGILEFSFGVLFARAVFHHARCFLKNDPSVIGTVGEDLADASLTDDRVAVFSDAGVAEELLNILQSACGFVNEVLAFS
jgi:hypothetical protein